MQNDKISKGLELQIAYAMAQAAAARTGAGYAAWYAVAGKFDDALRDYRAGFVESAGRAIKTAQRSAAFAEMTA